MLDLNLSNLGIGQHDAAMIGFWAMAAGCSAGNYSLLIAHCSPLTAHCLLLTAHCSLLTAHCSLLTTNYEHKQWPSPHHNSNAQGCLRGIECAVKGL